MPKARLRGIRQNEVVHRNKNEPVSSLRLRLFITSIKYLLYCQSQDCIQKDGGENGKNTDAGVWWHPDTSSSCAILDRLLSLSTLLSLSGKQRARHLFLTAISGILDNHVGARAEKRQLRARVAEWKATDQRCWKQNNSNSNCRDLLDLRGQPVDWWAAGGTAGSSAQDNSIANAASNFRSLF